MEHRVRISFGDLILEGYPHVCKVSFLLISTKEQGMITHAVHRPPLNHPMQIRTNLNSDKPTVLYDHKLDKTMESW